MTASRPAPPIALISGAWALLNVLASVLVLANDSLAERVAVVHADLAASLHGHHAALAGITIVLALVLAAGAWMAHQGNRTGLRVLLFTYLTWSVAIGAFAFWCMEEFGRGKFIDGTSIGQMGLGFLGTYFGIVGAIEGVIALALAALTYMTMKAPVTAPAAAAPATTSLAAELERLKDLHGRGVLSDAEFDAAKRKLLG